MNAEIRSTGRRRKATVGRHVGGDEVARPRKVAPRPWWLEAKAWPWSWNETRDQFEAKRKIKAEVV